VRSIAITSFLNVSKFKIKKFARIIRNLTVNA
jgi:hypothetical protein